jgi:hypothetical protein
MAAAANRMRIADYSAFYWFEAATRRFPNGALNSRGMPNLQLSKEIQVTNFTLFA